MGNKLKYLPVTQFKMKNWRTRMKVTTHPRHDQLPVGLKAEPVENCTDIAEAKPKIIPFKFSRTWIILHSVHLCLTVTFKTATMAAFTTQLIEIYDSHLRYLPMNGMRTQFYTNVSYRFHNELT